MGTWFLVGITILYLFFIAYIESVDTLMHHVRSATLWGWRLDILAMRPCLFAPL
jgi:hypothetical protein